MNIGEFKQAVRELRQALIKQEEQEVVSLSTQLSALLQDLSDGAPVYPEIMVEVRLIFDQFWAWVVKSIAREKWQQGDEVSPWLDLQTKLSHAGLLMSDYHYSVLYRLLAKQYHSLGHDQLKLEKLLFMLTRCGQLIGYAEKEELPTYPLTRLHVLFVNVEQNRLWDEAKQLKTKTALLLTTFYLLHRYCTVEQLALIPQLIYYRSPVTDEEKCSELAIFTSLCSEIPAWQSFFALGSHGLDTKEFRQQACLKNVVTLIPPTRSALFSAVHKKRWIYSFIYQTRQLKSLEENALLSYTIQLLREDFDTLANNSYSAALAFAAVIRKQIICLTEKEISLIQDALYAFCLHVYEEERHSTIHPAPFSFSGKTKCNAAEKKRQALAGLPIKYGFLEVIALKRGRLGALVDMFERGRVV